MRLVCGLYITKTNENYTTREYIGVDGRHAAPKGASDKKKERLDWADVDEQIFSVCLFVCSCVFWTGVDNACITPLSDAHLQRHPCVQGILWLLYQLEHNLIFEPFMFASNIVAPKTQANKMWHAGFDNFLLDE